MNEISMYIGPHSETLVVKMEDGWYVSKTLYGAGTHAVCVLDTVHIIPPERFARPDAGERKVERGNA